MNIPDTDDWVEFHHRKMPASTAEKYRLRKEMREMIRQVERVDPPKRKRRWIRAVGAELLSLGLSLAVLGTCVAIGGFAGSVASALGAPTLVVALVGLFSSAAVLREFARLEARIVAAAARRAMDERPPSEVLWKRMH